MLAGDHLLPGPPVVSARDNVNPDHGPATRLGAPDRNNSPAAQARLQAGSGLLKPKGGGWAGRGQEMARRCRRQ